MPTFMDLLEEWLELREKGPNEHDGYTDVAYWNRLYELRATIDGIVDKLKEK